MKFKGCLTLATLSLFIGCSTAQPKEQAVAQSLSPAIKKVSNKASALSAPKPIVQVADANNLWEHMRKHFQLEYDVDDPQIQHFIKRYTHHNRHFLTLMERAQPFQYLISTAVRERKMPMEIALLPMVESALDPFADSQTQASGMWQIIKPTATLLGLQQDWWYDARRDHVASTDAALDYLSYLHQRFDKEWLLALAAYNSGEGTVSRAIYKNKKQDKPTDFADLRLPKETRDYVPKLLALVTLVKNPEKYGLTLPKLENKAYLKSVDIGAQIDLALAAELAELKVNELYHLNPGYNRWATHPDMEGPHHLLLPVKNASKLERKIAYSDTDEWVNWQTYEVQPGDTLIKIAKRHHTTLEVLKVVNHMEVDTIIVGKGILVPKPLAPFARYAASNQKCTASGCFRDRNLIHTVKRGESLWVIGKRYSVTVDHIMGWNQLEAQNKLKPGQKLVIRTK